MAKVQRLSRFKMLIFLQRRRTLKGIWVRWEWKPILWSNVQSNVPTMGPRTFKVQQKQQVIREKGLVFATTKLGGATNVRVGLYGMGPRNLGGRIPPL